MHRGRPVLRLEVVPGAFLHYLPFLENTFAQQCPEFRKDGRTFGLGLHNGSKTKPDGTYRLVGLPGHAIVGVGSDPPST